MKKPGRERQENGEDDDVEELRVTGVRGRRPRGLVTMFGDFFESSLRFIVFNTASLFNNLGINSSFDNFMNLLVC